MRVGLIAALRHSEAGGLRAEVPLAGRSVIAWQADILAKLGVERVLCLTASAPASGEIIALQHAVEGQGRQFHALTGLAAIPALVRAEDDLIIIADGLVPDQDVMQRLLTGAGETITRGVATIPAAHPLAAAFPDDFERIDAARHWAGVLAMRGAPAQHLADFPDDADTLSLLLRIALQAGTPCRALPDQDLPPHSWLLAADEAALAQHETALIARAAPPSDWRAPLLALGRMIVRGLVPRGLTHGGLVTGGVGLGMLLVGIMLAAFRFATAGLILACLGTFSTQISLAFSALAQGLRHGRQDDVDPRLLGGSADALAGVTLWFALVPWPQWQPLAIIGMVVMLLARLVARQRDALVGVIAADRAFLLFLLALAAAFGLLPLALACLALGLLAALLLHRERE